VQSFASRLGNQRRGATPATEQSGSKPAAERPSLAVIGAGFGRTGTMSLKLALEQLGLGPCYHMTEMVKNPSHPAQWSAAGRGEPVDWRQLFGRYRCTVDWPGCHFYRELMQEYPEAKVILTVRDPQSWYDSVANTLYSLKTATDSYLSARASSPDPAQKPSILYSNRIWDETFGGRFEDRDYAIEVFERHNAEVIASVGPDRLLVYQVSEGWQPLCTFLGIAEPDSPFPDVNSTKAFREYNRTQLRPV
jgi:Sulfotransferase domain